MADSGGEGRSLALVASQVQRHTREECLALARFIGSATYRRTPDRASRLWKLLSTAPGHAASFLVVAIARYLHARGGLQVSICTSTTRYWVQGVRLNVPCVFGALCVCVSLCISVCRCVSLSLLSISVFICL